MFRDVARIRYLALSLSLSRTFRYRIAVPAYIRPMIANPKVRGAKAE